jgi:hypothetical protein
MPMGRWNRPVDRHSGHGNLELVRKARASLAIQSPWREQASRTIVLPAHSSSVRICSMAAAGFFAFAS